MASFDSYTLFSGIALFCLVSSSFVHCDPCPEGQTKCIGEPYAKDPSQGRKLFQTRATGAARVQSQAPMLANRRSLLNAMCSQTDYSSGAVIDCTNAVRLGPHHFDFSCGSMNGYQSLGALGRHGALMDAAVRHAKDNAYMGTLSHTGSDGSSASGRVGDAGYAYGVVRENIAYGYVSAWDVVDGWMCSSGHRDNIMSCDIHEIGVGYATGSDGRYYHAQVFACPRGDSCGCGAMGDGEAYSGQEPKREPKDEMYPTEPKDEMYPTEPAPQSGGRTSLTKDDDCPEEDKAMMKTKPEKEMKPKPYGGYLDHLFGGSSSYDEVSSDEGSYTTPGRHYGDQTTRYEEEREADAAGLRVSIRSDGHEYKEHKPSGDGRGTTLRVSRKTGGADFFGRYGK